MSVALEPPMAPGGSPPFYQIPPLIFQQLCRDLLAHEPAIATSDVYGTSGQKQYGIDVIGYVAGGGAVEVGQCKCYRAFIDRQILAASEEFLKHIERWKHAGVRRFILFVACDLDGQREQDTYLSERRRFQDLGIQYEIWTAATLSRKLQPHPEIIIAHIANPDYWVKLICGKALETYPTAPSASSDVNVTISEALVSRVEVLDAHLAQVRDRLGGLVARQIADLRRAWRNGERRAAWDGVRAIRGDQMTWEALPAEVQARVLCLEGGLALDGYGDLANAQACVDAADALAATDQAVRLRALIAYRQHGSAAALAILDGQQDGESLTLLASFLLETNQLDACAHILTQALATSTPPTEALRVQALLQLAQGDTDAAQASIDAALQREPTWEHLRTNAAMIAYARCLSPAAVPRAVLPWPEPIEWAYVRVDDASLERLRAAEAHFAAVCAAQDRAAEQRSGLAIWRLACLANDPDRQAAAAELCGQLLRSDAAPLPAVAWGLARRYPFDRRVIEQRCYRLLEQHQATPNHVLALVVCYLDTNRARRACQLLDRTRALFAGGTEAIWQIWRDRAAALTGSGHARAEAIPKHPTLEWWHARTLTLRRQARQTQDLQLLREHLARAYAATAEAEFLFELGEVLAQQGAWAELAAIADDLIGAVGTAATLRLAVIGCFNAQQYAHCLSLLENHRSLLLRQQLPPQLQRIRTLAKHAQGIVVEALADAEALAREEPTTDNLMLLAQIAARNDERAVLDRVARELLHRPDLGAVSAIMLCEVLARYDTDLARALWRQAMSGELPDEIVTRAMTLGFQLELDQETYPLLQRMAALAAQGRGGIEQLTVEETVERFRRMHERAQEIEAAYRAGTIPIHFTAGGGHATLAERYHRLLEWNAAARTPSQIIPLFIRHGGRSGAAGFPEGRPAGRLHMDLTALLLAAHIAILDTVETTFRPIHISDQVLLALRVLQEQAQPIQPLLLRRSEQLMWLIERGNVRTTPEALPPCDDAAIVAARGADWGALYAYARAQGGILLDEQHRARDGGPDPRPALPAGAHDVVATCRTFVESVRRHHPLTDHAYRAALATLDDEASDDAPRDILPGSLIVCAAETAERLLLADVLAVGTERYRIVVTADAVRRAQAIIHDHQERQRLVIWLDSLQRRINRGVASGAYAVLPHPPHDPDVDDEDGLFDVPGMQDMLTLLRSDLQTGDVVWIDDRFVSKHPQMGSADIVGITDVLTALVDTGALSADDRYRILITLRAQDVRFLPVECAEICYHLRQATVSNGRVIETTHLRTLRRSVARCLLPDTTLQWPPPDAVARGEYAEAPFSLSLSNAVLDAIITVWDSDADPVTRMAHADWIYEHLYVPLHVLRRAAAGPRAEQNDPALAAASLASLVMRAIALSDTPQGEIQAPRHAYFTWLNVRVLQPTHERDPELLPPAADVVKQSLISVHDDNWDAQTAAAAIAVIRRWYDDLPALIQHEIQQDAAFLQRLGRLIVQTVPIGDVVFRASTFYTAARDALNGRPSQVTDLEGDQSFVIETPLEPYTPTAIQVTHATTGARLRFANPVLDALYEDEARRRTALRQQRAMADYGRDTFEQHLAAVNATDDPETRMEQVHAWWRSSAAVYYDQLARRVRQTGAIDPEDVVPIDADGLLRHYRLSPDIQTAIQWSAALEASARQLLDEDGLATAIERLSRFPISLPPVLVTAAAALPRPEQRALIARLLRRGRTPLLMLHLLHILAALPTDDAAYGRLARRLIVQLLDPYEQVTWRAFHALLTWTNTAFGHWSAAGGWSAPLRLAMTWAHAETMLRIFRRAGSDAEALTEIFAEQFARLPRELFERDRALWFDIAHPRLMHHERLLLAGLAASLGPAAAAVLDLDLRARILVATFREVGEEPVPAPALLIDPARGENVLGSWLGADIGAAMAVLIDPAFGPRFDRPALRALASNILAAIADVPHTLEMWARLHLVLGQLPPYADMVEPLRTQLYQVDLPALIRSAPVTATYALHTLAQLAYTLADATLAQSALEHLGPLARSLPTIEETLDDPFLGASPAERAQTLRHIIVDAALHVAVAAHAHPPQDVVRELVALLTMLLDANPAIAAVCRPLLHYLCQALPLEQVRACWPAVIRARAME